ncbi:hypothetical protein [Synechococcus phage DSL-LC03]|nr:hypothetical protein [Synechococcus phage DSL-LC03]
MGLIRVDGERGLFRDEKSTAIINTDKDAYAEYLDARNRKIQEMNEIETLKAEVSELKELMRQLIQKL